MVGKLAYSWLLSFCRTYFLCKVCLIIPACRRDYRSNFIYSAIFKPYNIPYFYPFIVRGMFSFHLPSLSGNQKIYPYEEANPMPNHAKKNPHHPQTLAQHGNKNILTPYLLFFGQSSESLTILSFLKEHTFFL